MSNYVRSLRMISGSTLRQRPFRCPELPESSIPYRHRVHQGQWPSERQNIHRGGGTLDMAACRPPLSLSQSVLDFHFLGDAIAFGARVDKCQLFSRRCTVQLTV